MKPKQFLSLLKEAGGSWSEDRAPSMGAAISYYSVFSLAPLLVIVITVAGFVFGADQVQGAIFGQLASLMGEDAAKAVDEMLQHAKEPEVSSIAGIASLLVLFVGATTVLAELQGALDRIWRVPASEKPKGNAIWLWIRQRLLTFGMVLAIAFLLIISLVFSAVLATLGKWSGGLFGAWEAVAHVFDLVMSFGLLTVAFAVIYKFMPSTHIPWRDVWVGAAVTSLLFAVGKWGIGLYLGKSDVASAFGLFSSLALMMIWVYYSAQIFLFGAEFTWVYANRYGSRVSRQAAEEIPMAPAANDPAPGDLVRVRRPSGVRRHLPQIILGAAFLGGAALAKLLPSGVKVFRRKLLHH
ncbi:MAG TPA: YihY/virulence factor BrkB family protein [Burkholderiales bacterium]|nr:YihY/virulence factor BrkB family protein [Burkholderiales bacterium]